MKVFRSQFVVEQRIFWRNRSGVFFTFVLPIALLCALVFSGDPVEGVAFIAALGIVSTGFQGLAIQLAMHRDQGVLKRLMATPLTPAMLVLAKAASVLVVALLELVVIIAISVVAFDAPAPQHSVDLLLVFVAGASAFVALGFALASIIPNGDAAPAVANAAYFALLLLAGVVAQVDGLPALVRVAGEQLPMSALIGAVDRTWLGDGTNVLLPVVVLVLWGVAGVLWTSRRFRWEPAHER